ncbi:hypothetical protein HanRHA438_Chr12g0542571 [Helianthus annuus]|nr:hypothetical protein HanRHA438_Chr12g0542571 [Helianthus annuus]
MVGDIGEESLSTKLTKSLVDSEAEQEKKPETHAEHSGIAFPSRRRIVLSLAQLNEATTTLVVVCL